MKRTNLLLVALFAFFSNASVSSNTSNFAVRFNFLSTANAIEHITVEGNSFFHDQSLDFRLSGGGGNGGGGTSGMEGGGSGSSAESKDRKHQQCIANSESARSQCINLYGSSGVALVTMCKWFEGKFGAVFGTTCSSTAALTTVKAYRWCNYQADNLASKCN